MAAAADDAGLPFRDGYFSLVVSRHPTEVLWPEIARVLTPGGTYLSQQVGAGIQPGADRLHDGPAARASGPQPGRWQSLRRRPPVLTITDLREQALRVEFFDVAAVVHFLRKVLWTVPGFTVAGYRDELARMHEHIQSAGSFVCHSQRFLIEARRPG